MSEKLPLYRGVIPVGRTRLVMELLINDSSGISCSVVGRDSSVGIATRQGWTVQGSNPGGRGR